MEELKKAVFLEAVKEQFCTTDKREALELMREQLTDVWNLEKSAELTAKIGEAMNEAETADGVTMTQGQRLIWAVKEAFILGCLDMAEKMMTVNDMGYEAISASAEDTLTVDKLETMGWKQLQAVDALCLLLDSLEHEGRTATDGPAAAETFVDRLRVYMGAFHLLADTFEDMGNAMADGGDKS